jgi:hypothetical protein
MTKSAEQDRLDESRAMSADWRRWGPYVSDRQWGTVREDYSAGGDSWTYFPFDHAHQRAYRWGEDGIAGWSDNQCRLCLSLAFWNGRDPILKERYFGLANGEGNHGEDVKELYYYLDATPTHSYMKMLYKYPQQEFPYARLRAENRSRGRDQPEFELLDTGLFDLNRYFDIFVEFAKASPNDTLLRVTVCNRGPEPATLHLLPQYWFRNTWSWRSSRRARPEISVVSINTLRARHPGLGDYFLHSELEGEPIFCENETNRHRLFATERVEGYFKDAFHDYVVRGDHSAVNPRKLGTKAAFHHVFDVPAGGECVARLRLAEEHLERPFAGFDETVDSRRSEADEFYGRLQHELGDDDARQVERQAFAGMIWSKQYYHYDITRWLEGDPLQPPPPDDRRNGRNYEWTHLNNADIISMPDKWEYPWYAAWDLAFHCITLALVDADFAKEQLVLLTREWYMQPSGQLPAYEWELSDVNPPVHAWAAWRVFQIDRKQRGDCGDTSFLERVFHKLLLNFTWWVNRKDAQGRNIFLGGFLGLDNIGVFDRSKPLPGGGHLEQADATAWMAMYCLNLMRIALELATVNPVYQDIATKFFEHFLGIAHAMTHMGEGGRSLWDEEDQFYYDRLVPGAGQAMTLRVRSMVGLIPLFAVETLEPDLLEKVPEFYARLQWLLRHRPELADLISRWEEPGLGERRLLSLLRGSRMKKLLRRALDESEFLSNHGIRSLSRHHRDHPFVFSCDGAKFGVGYEPGESQSPLFGGNSNWRGPVWVPVNFLIIESLQKFHHYYGNDFKIECPTGSLQFLTINEVAQELTLRLTRIFLRDAGGRRPVFGNDEKLQRDPHFCDYIPFFEFFHGDNGRGLGASHQTGWTGLIAKLLLPRRDDCRHCDLEHNQNAELGAEGSPEDGGRQKGS